MATAASPLLSAQSLHQSISMVPEAARVGEPLSMEAVPVEDWDGIVADFDGVSQEQLYAFAKKRWPGVVQEARVFRLDGEIVAGVLMMVQPLPLKLGAIAICKWGPILKDEKRPDAEAIYAGVIEGLIEEYDRKRRMMISVLPRAAKAAGNAEHEYLRSRGFGGTSQLRFPNRYIVNLRLTDEEQRKSFGQKWRYHLNKSAKESLEFEHAGPERLPEFDALYRVMTDRKRFPDHSAYDVVPTLMALEDERLRPELFFVRHLGEVVAGAIIFKAGDTAVYLYGATNDRALPLRAGYFMHWEIIRWLRDNTRATWYDLGGTDGFQGLHQFKKGMVGDRGVISQVPPVSNFSSHFVPSLLGSAAFAARDAVQHLKHIIERVRGDLAKPDQERSAS